MGLIVARCDVVYTGRSSAYRRNHGSVPAVDRDAYRLALVGEVRSPLLLSLPELRERFPRTTVTATLACAGNRRRERSIERVEVSPDGGKSWLPASLVRGTVEPWTWRLWRAEVDLAPGSHELVVRAWDGSTEGQPEDVATTWNPRGYMNNAWHRVTLTSRSRDPVLRNAVAGSA